MLALLGLLATAAPGAAVPRTARASSGVLTGDTTITWRGVTGIRLRTTGTGSLPEESMTLVVKGGTYAFVDMLPDPQPEACRRSTPWPHCYGFGLSLFPGSHVLAARSQLGHDHLTKSSRPPDIIGRHLDVYLFTDGEATLRLRPHGYRGRSAYVAAGRIRGGAVRLPESCRDVCGETPAGSVVAGGVGIDFGKRPGHLITHSYTVAAPSSVAKVPNNHPQSVRTCYYPGIDHPWASPDPRDHPYGCETPTDRDAHAGSDAVDGLNSLSFGSARWSGWNVGDQTGKRYVGFSVARAWPERGISAGYAVWFNYGIR